MKTKAIFLALVLIVLLATGATTRSRSKVYVANLTQFGYGDPVVTVLENTTGLTFVVTRVTTGTYDFTASAGMDEPKTAVFVSDNNFLPVLFSARFEETNTIRLRTTSLSTLTDTDGALYNTKVEIRIYP